MERRTIFLIAVILVLFSSYIIGNIFWMHSGVDTSSEFANNVMDKTESRKIGSTGLFIAFAIFFSILIYMAKKDKSFAKVLGIVLALAMGRVFINMTIFTHTWAYWIPFLVLCFAGLFYARKKDLKYHTVGIGVGLVILAIVYWGTLEIFPHISKYLYSDSSFSQIDFGSLFPETNVGYIYENSGWFVLILLFSSLFLVILIPQLKRLISKSSDEIDTQTTKMEEDISESVEDAIIDLKEGKDIKSSVIRCYQKMCMILTEHGLFYDEHMTSREFQEYAIENLSISKNSISNITKTFEKARYGLKKMDESDRKMAIENLREFRKEMSE